MLNLSYPNTNIFKNQLRNDIQFLRGFSVSLVLLYHFNFNIFNNFLTKGGYIGVDIFFILSGYIITKIIIDQKSSFKLKEFYIKRIKRIIPTLFTVVFFSLIISIFLFENNFFILKKNADSVYSILLGLSNLWFWINSTIYQLAAENNLIFLHTWSLSIEIQFFLIYPIFFIFLKKKNIIYLLTLIFFISYISIFVLYKNHNIFNFYFTLSRAFEISSGCLAFLFQNKIQNFFYKILKKKNQLIIIFGFLLVLLYMYFLKDEDNHPNPLSIVFVLGICLILIFFEKSIVKNYLLIPFEKIGLISYSLYLWHFPIILISSNYFDLYNDHNKFLSLIFCVLISIISYIFIEKKFRYSNFSNCFIYIFILIISILFTVEFIKNKKISETKFILDNYFLADESVKFLKNTKKIRKQKNIFSFPSDSESYSPQFTNLPNEKVLFFGDSHSKDMFNIFYTNKSLFENFEFARYGINLKDFRNFRKDIFLNSENFKKSNYLILSAYYKMEDLNYIKEIEEISKLYKKKLVVVLNRPVFEANNEKNVSILDIYYKENPNFKKKEMDHFFYSKLNKKNYIKINNEIKKMYSDLNLFSLENIICSHDKKLCHSVDEDLKKNIYDYGHFTLSGAQFFGKKIFETGLHNLLFFK